MLAGITLPQNMSQSKQVLLNGVKKKKKKRKNRPTFFYYNCTEDGISNKTPETVFQVIPVSDISGCLH